MLNYLHAHSPQFVPFALYGNGDLALVVSASDMFAASLAANENLVGLDIARKLLSTREDRACPQLLQPSPSGLVTAKPSRSCTGMALTPSFRVETTTWS
jgi:hypothetical protein